MKQIYSKIQELYELTKTIPDECKGSSEKASMNRRIYIRIKNLVQELVKPIQ